MTRNRTPTPVYLDPGMHPGLEVKGLSHTIRNIDITHNSVDRFHFNANSIPNAFIGRTNEVYTVYHNTSDKIHHVVMSRTEHLHLPTHTYYVPSKYFQ